ncbi:helix-turn-helix domain-containing protein [Amycolatopsis tucumanensis]|uniref:XRE family transcriptional regulator n=1 Tax=Amycolatopsis tucumanensis TaxID=401106 RepID=A0ABP7J5J4_9PSEU|nr:XRE family transcriptional regulator [Amycolatopsis tucumanensis]MCF6423278.1 XRE family transcriptional regulator [Amycolatopsis tucumanensis]
MEWTEIGERVREARVSAGLSQGELAAEIGLDRTMVVKVERGARRLDALEVARLAEALAVPLGYFLDPRPAVVSRRSSPLLDDTGTNSGRAESRLEAALFEWLGEVRQLIDLGLLSALEPLTFPGKVDGPTAAREAARWLRKHLGLGVGPIDTMMSVCERAGQFLLVTELTGDGASLTDDGLAVAVVNSAADPGRRRATAAHELGHLVLGDEYSTDLGVAASREDRERAIDAFAAELLLPVSVVREGWPREEVPAREFLIELAARYRTSWSTAIRQAQHAEVVEGSTARRWRASTPTRAEMLEALGWAPQPDLTSVTVPPSFAHAVMEAWRSDQITSDRAVELLHGQITIDDLPPRDDAELAP